MCDVITCPCHTITLLHASSSRQNIHVTLDSQQTPHSSPPWASYGVSIAKIAENIDCIMWRIHCVILQECGKVSANERRRYTCNVFSHWPRPFSTIKRKQAMVFDWSVKLLKVCSLLIKCYAILETAGRDPRFRCYWRKWEGEAGCYHKIALFLSQFLRIFITTHIYMAVVCYHKVGVFFPVGFLVNL